MAGSTKIQHDKTNAFVRPDPNRLGSLNIPASWDGGLMKEINERGTLRATRL